MEIRSPQTMRSLLDRNNLSSRYTYVRGLSNHGYVGEVHLVKEGDIERILKLPHQNASRILSVDTYHRLESAGDFMLRKNLTHPNLVQAVDAGTLSQEDYPFTLPFLVTEYLSGGSLPRLSGRENTYSDRPIRTVLDLLIPIADAVQVLHGAGITHNAIHPEHLRVSGDGTLKLSDLTLATQVGSTVNVIPTHAAFVPPELNPSNRDRPDYLLSLALPASDVFSLGCVIYTLIADHYLFSNNHLTALDAVRNPRHVEQTIERSIGMSYTTRDKLNIALRRAVAFQPADRYPDAGAFADALREAREDLVVKPLVNPKTVIDMLKTPEGEALFGQSGCSTLINLLSPSSNPGDSDKLK